MFLQGGNWCEDVVDVRHLCSVLKRGWRIEFNKYKCATQQQPHSCTFAGTIILLLQSLRSMICFFPYFCNAMTIEKLNDIRERILVLRRFL